MKLRFGDIWNLHENYNTDLICVTSCSQINESGDLVMNDGIRNYFKGIDKRFGKQINHISSYGLCIDTKTAVGIFQIKYHHNDTVNFDLVQKSAYKLRRLASSYSTQRFDLMLPESNKYAMLSTLGSILPTNVYVWLDPSQYKIGDVKYMKV